MILDIGGMAERIRARFGEDRSLPPVRVVRVWTREVPSRLLIAEVELDDGRAAACSMTEDVLGRMAEGIVGRKPLIEFPLVGRPTWEERFHSAACGVFESHALKTIGRIIRG